MMYHTPTLFDTSDDCNLSALPRFLPCSFAHFAFHFTDTNTCSSLLIPLPDEAVDVLDPSFSFPMINVELSVDLPGGDDGVCVPLILDVQPVRFRHT